MLPNELYQVSRKEFEQIYRDPAVQLAALNIEIAYTNSMISVLSGRLNSLEEKRRELIGEVLK